MSEAEFVNGYWYAVEVKAFAKSLGISPVSTLRKDELEKLILKFLRTGKVPKAAGRKANSSKKPKDSASSLGRSVLIERYTNDQQTKEFLLSEAAKVAPGFQQKSGAMYRLNRWREEQMESGVQLTYGELVDKYVELCETVGAFPQAPSGRYINFLSDFLKAESNATRSQALQAWGELKKLQIPKDYRSWKKHQRKRSSGRRRS